MPGWTEKWPQSRAMLLPGASCQQFMPKAIVWNNARQQEGDVLTKLIACACLAVFLVLPAEAQTPAPAGTAPAAPPAPSPKAVPQGAPARMVEVMTAEGVALLGGQWRDMDARIVEAPPRPNRSGEHTYGLQSTANLVC